MKFNVLTLFPEMFSALDESIIGRGKEKGLIDINLINIRDFSKNKHKKVDDTPYGGGAGMVMEPTVVYDAYCSVKEPNAKVICSDIIEYSSKEKFDYIFISSGSISLFTDINLLKKILKKFLLSDKIQLL